MRATRTQRHEGGQQEQPTRSDAQQHNKPNKHTRSNKSSKGSEERGEATLQHNQRALSKHQSSKPSQQAAFITFITSSTSSFILILILNQIISNQQESSIKSAKAFNKNHHTHSQRFCSSIPLSSVHKTSTMDEDFVPDNSTMLEAWDGFLPCNVMNDCIFNNQTIYSLVIKCSPMTNSPDPSQDYCHCDIGLGGTSCTDITTTAMYNLWLQLFGLVLSFAATSFGVWELYERRRERGRANAIVISVRIAVLACFAVVSWNFWGGIFILTAGYGWDITVPRALYLTTFVPGAIVITLCSVLVISLAWRKVVIDWNSYRTDVNSEAVARRESRVYKAVLFSCAFLFIGSAAIGVTGRLAYGTTVSIAAYVVTLVFFIHSGRKFTAQFSSTVKSNSGRGNDGFRLWRCLESAKAANRNASIGLTLVLVSMGFLAIAHSQIGFPSEPDEIEISAVAHTCIQVGCLMTNMVAISYARDARLSASYGKALNSTPATSTNGKYTANVDVGEVEVGFTMDMAYLYSDNEN